VPQDLAGNGSDKQPVAGDAINAVRMFTHHPEVKVSSSFNRRADRLLAVATAVALTCVTFAWTLELFAQLGAHAGVASFTA
jgi:hemoglobin-like flavoprotein